MTRSTTALPGFGAPAVGFDTPFEMLEACHERVQRTLALLEKLCRYLDDHACDDSARQAARDVLRYFDLAAPLHHEDEELHIFPLLLVQGTPEVVQRVRQLQHDHERMAAHWQDARLCLLALADGQSHAFTAQDEAAFARFAGGYAAHIASEEEVVYPAARALLSEPAVQQMGQKMRQRRGAVA
ncbi:hemerythrin domain-containing protein [Simplicispira psychrophila]|uniref:hemerythrin domain-containing protein n=1 Tax=Simplicispira psychrophila TaxID=80882 RepID=UPI0005683047|nr:hemerythrin domain-containing protein [Simplicispira psychrophila]